MIDFSTHATDRPSPPPAVPVTSDAVLAMDRLNSFVRTGAAMSYGDSFRHHVYAMKSAAIRSLDDDGLTTARRVYVVVKCGKCGGSGEYRHSRFDARCWACDGAGTKELHFLETRIGRTLWTDWPLPDLVWHSPRSGEANDAERVTDWKPRTPGREMTVEEVATALNAAESVWRSPLWAASHYALWLGRVEGSCAFCGGSDELQHEATWRGRLGWGAQSCWSCRQHYRRLSDRYGAMNLLRDRLPLREAMLTPAVRVWIHRHGGMRQVQAARPEENFA